MAFEPSLVPVATLMMLFGDYKASDKSLDVDRSLGQGSGKHRLEGGTTHKEAGYTSMGPGLTLA